MGHPEPRWQLQFDGYVRDRDNTKVTDYRWEIALTVRYHTDRNVAETLAAARDRLFTDMRDKFGAVFFCKYAERIRVPLVQAVHQLTDALYCVEAAEGTFTSTPVTEGWESNQAQDMLLLDIQAMLIPPIGRAKALRSDAHTTIEVCRATIQDQSAQIEKLESEVRRLKLDLFAANEHIRVHT